MIFIYQCRLRSMWTAIKMFSMFGIVNIFMEFNKSLIESNHNHPKEPPLATP